MKEKTSLSFVKSGSAALILYVTLFFAWGWWNVLWVILYPLYFIIIDLLMLFAGKGETNSNKSQLKYYLQTCMDNKGENIDVHQEVDNCIAGYQIMCRRVTHDTWKEMKNHLLTIYNKENGQTYYEILGINSTATTADIKHAYKTLSKKYHPDANYGKSDIEKKNAEDKFKEVNEAYRVLIGHY